MTFPLGIALLHHPVTNRNGETVTTAVTNLDVHDIARSAMTYGLSRFYLVTPAAEQQRLVQRLLHHWLEGFGSQYNPDRRRALSLVRMTSSLEEALEDFSTVSGTEARPILTGASRRDGLTFERGRAMLNEAPVLLTLGTGSGMADELFQQGWPVLEPLRGPSNYTHLSVRAAAAIMLDRLTGSGMAQNG